MKTYAMMVLGCKVNDFESNYVKEQMDKDYLEVSFKESADIYIIFTCCVTNFAEAKTRKFIRSCRRKNKNAYIVAVGCYAQVKKDEDVFKDVDLVIGSKHKDKIKEYIDKAIKKNDVSTLDDVQFEYLDLNNYLRKTRAFLKIQDGCNQFCSYCIIPYARGRQRSGEMNILVKQASKLAEHSKEIVLTGIHTGRYFDGSHNLVDLLRELEKIDNLKTIRLSSIEITEISDDLLEFFKYSKKMAHHLHIPLQSGSDRILNLMNRPYTTKCFYDRVTEIRKAIPHISISTDLIVGFPTESDEDFKETMNFLKKISFSFIHVFPYSRKKGTKADTFDGHLPNDIKKKREKDVFELEKEITLDYKKSWLNKCAYVFIEQVKEGYSYGYSKEYLYTKINKELTIGSIVQVNFLSIDEDAMVGEVCY